MKAFTYDNATAGLADLAHKIIKYGDRVPSRVGNTHEFEDVTILVPSHRAMPYQRPGSSFRDIGLIEGAGLITGTSVARYLKLVAPKITDFTDFYGEYGPRARDQWELIVKTLDKDPSTRRAVLQIWDPVRDLPGGHLDHPCTISITFRIRDGALNQTVHMRSNDLYLGWSNDVVQFSVLHLTLAAALGVRVGTYVHHSDSLHVYERNFELLDPFVRMTQHELDNYGRAAGELHDTYPLKPFSMEVSSTALGRWRLAQEAAHNYLNDLAERLRPEPKLVYDPREYTPKAKKATS